MRAKLEHIKSNKTAHSFLCYEIAVPFFEFYWHYHPELELTYILSGRGKRLIGDSYESFAEGDLVLLGPNLPHTWISDKKSKQAGKAIVVQFHAGLMESLGAFPELSALYTLTKHAAAGLFFPKVKGNRLSSLMQRMATAEDNGRFTVFIELFQLLAGLRSKPIASRKYTPFKGKENEQRINKVFQHVEANFRGTLTVTGAARIISLSESAFCKFFKRVSGKTFSDYVNEIRVAHACTLLVETDKPINLVANESGFENLAYFNRVFLRKKKIQPGVFRKLN